MRGAIAWVYAWPVDPLAAKLGAHRAGLRCMRLFAHDEGDDDGTGIGDEGNDAPRKRMKTPPTLPAFIHLTPPGPMVEGRDGRSFAILDPAAVIAATAPELPMLVDWDHESMFGMSTRAAAWVDRVVFVPEGEESADFPAAGFWGHVEAWTPEGADDVQNLRFRMISPVIQHEERELEEGAEALTPSLLRFENVALTNRPNLRMVSMNSEGAHDAHGDAMNDEQIAALRVLLGLDGEADGDAVVEAVRARVMPNADDDAPPPPADDDDEEDDDAPPAAETAQLAADLAAATAANRVLTSDLEELRASLAEHTAAQAAELLTAQTKSVDDAIDEGRANAAHRADLLSLATSKREEDRAIFGRLTEKKLSGAPKGRVAGDRERKPAPGRRRKATGHKAEIDALTEADAHTYRAMKSAGFKHDAILAKLEDRAAN